MYACTRIACSISMSLAFDMLGATGGKFFWPLTHNPQYLRTVQQYSRPPAAIPLVRKLQID
jgi:hypothetical protein